MFARLLVPVFAVNVIDFVLLYGGFVGCQVGGMGWGVSKMLETSFSTTRGSWPGKECGDMNDKQANNPMHGITLEKIVISLVDYYGWSELGQRINIRCFNSDPSVRSSLKFLRKTPWARKKVEDLYIAIQDNMSSV